MISTVSRPPVNRPLEPRRRAIIIGASSGTGAALARRLAGLGYSVAAVARRGEQLQQLADDVRRFFPAAIIHTYVHDVGDAEEIPALFERIVRDLGGLDLIIYAAAVQPVMSLNEYNFEKDAEMIRVNLLGAIAWLNQAAARFARTGGGHIVGIGSIAGDRGRVAGPVYNTSKAGLDTYLEALRNRLSRHGVAVTTVKLGFVDTRLLENAARTFWVITPAEAAARITEAIRRRKQVVYIPARWRMVSLIIRSIPSFIFRRLSF